MKKQEITLNGSTLSIETGQVARQSSGSVIVTHGETVILVAVNAAKIAAIESKRIEDILAINGQRYLLNDKRDEIIATIIDKQTTNVVNNTALIEPDINPADRFDPHSPIGGVVLR